MIVQHYLWPKGSLSRRWPENEYWIYHIIRNGNKLPVIWFPPALSLQLKNKDMPSKWDKSGYFICLFAKWQFSCILREFLIFFKSLIYVINCQNFQGRRNFFGENINEIRAGSDCRIQSAIFVITEIWILVLCPSSLE